MIKLNLSITRGLCSVKGCDNQAGVFGVCHKHEQQVVREFFHQSADLGICSKERPPCFASDEEWHEYVVANALSRDKKAQHVTVDFCRDCTPLHKDKMMEEGRCSHPETVFIRSDRYHGDVIGVAIGKSSTQWESAMMGMYGPVVKLPPHDVTEQMLAKIAQDKAPKKRGPKFKKDRL